MKKLDVTKMFNTVKRAVGKKSPEILIGIGIAGMFTSIGLAIKATPKAMKKIEEEKKFKEKEAHEGGIFNEGDDKYASELTPVEIIKATWKCYVPAAISAATSIACIIGANSVHSKRNAAIATAYKLSEKALTEYKDAVIDEVGEEKATEIREKIAKQHIDEAVSNSPKDVVGEGDVLFLEPICGKLFRSDKETVRKVINDFNYRMITGCEEYISLSEFYDEFGIKHTRASDNLGWNLYTDGQIEIDFILAQTDGGNPCLELDYNVAPRYDFSKLM